MICCKETFQRVFFMGSVLLRLDIIKYTLENWFNVQTWTGYTNVLSQIN